MTIGEILKLTDTDTYYKLLKLFKIEIKKPKPIKLGCSIENLMKSDSYSRSGRRVRQRGWG